MLLLCFCPVLLGVFIVVLYVVWLFDASLFGLLIHAATNSGIYHGPSTVLSTRPDKSNKKCPGHCGSCSLVEASVNWMKLLRVKNVIKYYEGKDLNEWGAGHLKEWEGGILGRENSCGETESFARSRRPVLLKQKGRESGWGWSSRQGRPHRGPVGLRKEPGGDSLKGWNLRTDAVRSYLLFIKLFITSISSL